jgi:hypothetical protein
MLTHTFCYETNCKMRYTENDRLGGWTPDGGLRGIAGLESWQALQAPSFLPSAICFALLIA